MNENEKFLTIWNDEGEQKIPIGFNTMLKGKMSFPNQADWATASSGAWTSDDTYRVKIYNYESPHALTVDFNFKGKDLIWDTEYNVKFGPTQLPPMMGRRD